VHAIQVAWTEVAHADVPNLPLRHEVVQCAKRFLYRQMCVAVMQLEQIDMIAAYTFQARLHRAHDVRAAETDLVLPGTRAQLNLGRNQHARLVETEIGNDLPYDLFRFSL
jgi:hypothetical protein